MWGAQPGYGEPQPDYGAYQNYTAPLPTPGVSYGVNDWAAPNGVPMYAPSSPSSAPWPGQGYGQAPFQAQPFSPHGASPFPYQPQQQGFAQPFGQQGYPQHFGQGMQQPMSPHALPSQPFSPHGALYPTQGFGQQYPQSPQQFSPTGFPQQFAPQSPQKPFGFEQAPMHVPLSQAPMHEQAQVSLEPQPTVQRLPSEEMTMQPSSLEHNQAQPLHVEQGFAQQAPVMPAEQPQGLVVNAIAPVTSSAEVAVAPATPTPTASTLETPEHAAALRSKSPSARVNKSKAKDAGEKKWKLLEAAIEILA